MSRLSRSMPLALLALGSLLAFGATAQSPQKPATTAASGTGTNGPDRTSDSDESFPVLAVTNVEVVRSSQAPALDIVVARGLTSTQGWTDAALIPLTRGTPSDSVLDLVLVANPPDDTGPSVEHGSIQAVLPLAPEHPFKAIRVRGARNTVLLRSLPGVAEAKAPIAACDPCVGKHFVAKGAPAPTGVPQDQLVHEEALPPTARIVRPTDGVESVRPNPNRLTVVIGEDGRIVDAMWE